MGFPHGLFLSVYLFPVNGSYFPLSLCVLVCWYFEFWSPSLICPLSFTLQSLQIASPCFLCRIYICTQWERQVIVCLFHLARIQNLSKPFFFFNKDEYLIVMKGTIHREDKIIINIYISKISEKFIK